MINKDLFMFLLGSGSPPPQNDSLTITIDNDGIFGEVEYELDSVTIVHIKNETNYTIIINGITFEGADYQYFSVDDLTSSVLFAGQEAIVYLTFTPNHTPNRFNQNYYAKIQVTQTNNRIVTKPLYGIGIIVDYDCGTDLLNTLSIDCGQDTGTTDTFDIGIAP